MTNHTLYAIAVISNPVGYSSRTRLFNEFVSRYENIPGLQIVRVELVSSGRDFVCTEKHNPFHVQLRSDSILWHKENMINIALQRLPADWQYAAWIDADITFYNPGWVADTITALQKYKVVQIFTHAVDLDKNGVPMQTVASFGYMYQKGHCKIPPVVVDPRFPGKHKSGIYSYGEFWHPGYAWAARRDTLKQMGWLMDFPILGSADHLMALGMIGDVDRITSADFSPDYLCAIHAWQAHAYKAVDREIGYVPGVIAHHFHGHKHHRGYQTRTGIIVKWQFDPDTDLYWDAAGVMNFVLQTDRQRWMASDVKQYFWSRREDDGEVVTSA
jgi:hypothetical protein